MAVAVADLGPSLRGVIVTLDESGALVVNYLGTDPLLTPVGLIEVRGDRVGHMGLIEVGGGHMGDIHQIGGGRWAHLSEAASFKDDHVRL